VQAVGYRITREYYPLQIISVNVKQLYVSGINHGTFLHIAHEEGLITNTSIHAGIRAPMARPRGDLRNDLRCGFEIIKARGVDRYGIAGVIERLKKRVSGTKVYISVDIDVLVGLMAQLDCPA
jgi:agmatinase